MLTLPTPVSVAWLVVKIGFYLLVSLGSVDIIVVAYQQF